MGRANADDATRDPSVTATTGDHPPATEGATPTRRNLLRRVGAGAAAMTGVAVAGCSGGGGNNSNGGDGNSGDDGGTDGDENDGSPGGTDEQDDGGSGEDSGDSTDGPSFEAETQAIQERFDYYAQYGYTRADADGSVQTDVEGLEVAESVAMTGTDSAGADQYLVLLAMRNVGSKTTSPHRYGYHLSVYDVDDQLVDDDSSQSSNSERIGPDGVDVVNVKVGFTEGSEGSLADVTSHEVLINCEDAGGANPDANGTYCA